jgi:hypothetical protein
MEHTSCKSAVYPPEKYVSMPVVPVRTGGHHVPRVNLHAFGLVVLFALSLRHL